MRVQDFLSARILYKKIEELKVEVGLAKSGFEFSVCGSYKAEKFPELASEFKRLYILHLKTKIDLLDKEMEAL